MSSQIKAAIAAALFALGLAVGWTAQGWRKDAELAEARVSNATILRDIATKTANTVIAVQKATTVANKAIAEADQKATERIAKNEEETSRLRECVRLGTCGVRIVTRVVRESSSAGAADPSSSSVGNAAVELDREAASRVLDLRESVQLDAEKLDYLQRYAETCRKARTQAAE